MKPPTSSVSPTFRSFNSPINEQTQEQVLKLFDELDELTREPFRKLKGEIDFKGGRAEWRDGR